MLPFVLAAAVAAPAPHSCYHPGPKDQVVARELLDAGDDEHFEAVAIAHKGDGPLGFSYSRAVVYTPQCGVAFQQDFPEAPRSLFSRISLGGKDMLLLTAFYPGGSGCGYRHLILKYGDDYPGGSVLPLAPMDLGHSNMGGFFAGDLGGGQGSGVAVWTPIWDDGESHYAAHRYQVITYRWTDDRLTGPTVTTSDAKVEAAPDAAAKALGLPYRDQTGQERFGGC